MPGEAVPFRSSTLADLVDAPALQSLMNDFYEIARIPMAIIDVEGKVLVGAGWQDICTKFHRAHPQTCHACVESDTELSAGIPPGEFRRYKCKNNMWDLATPIMVRDRHVGNVFSGQFFFEDEHVDYALFREQAHRYGFDEREYIAALDRVPRLPREAVDRALAFFVKLAHTVSQLGDANVTLGQMIAERDTLTQSLRESEADLAHGQAVAHTGSWRLDVCRNALTWSAEVYRMFGVPPATSLTYEGFLAKVHPDDRAAVDAAWQAALAGQPYDVQHRIVVGEDVKWVRETAELEFDAQGTLLGGFGTVQDVTRHRQAEQALRDSHELLRTVIDSTTDLVFLKDCTGRYVVMNQAGAAALGRPIDEIVGKTDRDLFPAAIARHIMEDDQRVLAGGTPQVLEETLEIGGQLRHLLTSKSPCRDSTGATSGLVGIARDVTERRQAEANQVLLTDILRIFNRGGELRSLIADALRLIQEVTGFDAVGLRLREGEDCPYYEQNGLSAEFVRREDSLCARDGDGEVLRDADGRAVLECTCGLVLSGRTDPSMSCFTRAGAFWTNASKKLLGLSRDADPRTNPRNHCIHCGYQSIGLFPVRVGDQIVGVLQLNDRQEGRFNPGSISFYETVAQNIGLALQRAAAEDALQQSEARLASILEQLPVGVGLVDRDGRWVVSNSVMRDFVPARIPSRDPQRVGRWHALTSEGQALDPGQWPAARALRGERVVPGVEFEYEGDDGRRCWTRVAAAPFRDTAAALAGAIVVMQDVTGAKQLEAELKDTVRRLAEGNRLKDQFLSTLSHELRTPLNAILGWSQLLQTHGVAYPYANRAIDAIARNAEAQARLVEDVLDVSRIITGKLHLRQQTLDLAVVIERALDTVRPAADAKDIAITTSFAPRAFVVGDPDRLQQVVWNLLSNAVKFTTKSGHIDIAVALVDSHVQVRITDTGIGIARDFMPHLFERFSQHDSSITRSYGGLGLGLAIVRHLVEMHGGTVEAESPGEGQGATFTVTLPVRALAPAVFSDMEPSSQVPAPSLLPTPPSLQGVRVLVVDDDASARELLHRVLTDFGADVVMAASAAEGMRLLQSARPDVLVSDIGMPEEDGYRFLRKVRSLPAELGGRVPAIALTAYGHAADRYQALSAGYDQHVAKPVMPQELAVVVAVAARKVHGV